MDYTKKLKLHYKPKKGWINDPNGLVYFNGYYHVFYQHSPNFEAPWSEPMCWGHARTRDFIEWEELPVALYPDKDYDCEGCWSGTAIVKDDILYLFYASLDADKNQRVSVAYSKDGINFEKYENNPVIREYPSDGGPDFRDPSLACIGGKYYCVMGTGNPETETGRLLLYESADMFNWEYKGIMDEWEKCRFTECPSFTKSGDGYLLSATVCPLESKRYFHIMYGDFENGVFTTKLTGEVDKGPDQYAGQMFTDGERCMLITWIPGWAYQKYAEKDVGCMSVPREITVKDGKIYGYPVAEIQPYLKDSDPAVRITDDGFEIERTNRESVVYKGKIDDIKIIRDEFILEVFINAGQEVYSVLL